MSKDSRIATESAKRVFASRTCSTWVRELNCNLILNNDADWQNGGSNEETGTAL